MLINDQGGTEFEQPPIGTHVARCVKIIDIGTQAGEYQGKPTRKRQIIIGWELPNELMQEGEFVGKPFAVSRFYTASLGEKANLRKDLANWRGKDFTKEELAGFEMKKLLGATCMLAMGTKEGSDRVRVKGVVALPKGMGCPTQVNPTFYLSLDPDEFDEATFDKLSEKMQDMVRKSPEYEALTAVETSVAGMADSPLDDDDSIPF